MNYFQLNSIWKFIKLMPLYLTWKLKSQINSQSTDLIRWFSATFYAIFFVQKDNKDFSTFLPSGTQTMISYSSLLYEEESFHKVCIFAFIAKEK